MSPHLVDADLTPDARHRRRASLSRPGGKSRSIARSRQELQFILAKPVATVATVAAPMPKKDRHRIAAAVPPVTRQPVGTGAVDAAGCRHTSPLDVAPERALPGSCDRLCPDGDHRRKAAEMKSSDPVDYRNPPRLPKSATAHPGMANGSPRPADCRGSETAAKLS